MLEVEGIQVSYAGVTVLRDVSLTVAEGETVAIVGSNGAGKSTVLRAISGLLRPDKGAITFRGRRIDAEQPHRIAKMGIAHVPEGRGLFQGMSVKENLLLGSYGNKSAEERALRLEKVFGIFPRLSERTEQLAGTMSGGEQQMLAIARGLMSDPALLMMDECSMGLMPTAVEEVFGVIRELRTQGTTLLLVEQRLREALDLADRAYILQTGRVVLEGTGKDLQGSEDVRRAYLGL
jgi:branched-chain amino acid transport system ATP-binding protein